MDYTRALEQAVMYIENHLLEDIRVEDVARNTGYSYYHLTRQFSAMLGESVGSYTRKNPACGILRLRRVASAT